MQNKAKLRKVKFNVNKVLTMNYDQMDTWSIRKKQSQTNPIQSQFKPNTKPKRTQFKPKQTQFQRKNTRPKDEQNKRQTVNQEKRERRNVWQNREFSIS
jgi:hypothetical protein